VLFNGIDLAQWIVITGMDIQDLPTTTPQAVNIGVSPGQKLLSNKLGTRTINLEYYLLDQSYKHDLAGALGSSNNQPAQLILGNDPDKYYMAVPSGGDSQKLTPVNGIVSGGSLNFVAYDPFIYGTDTFTATNDGTSSITIYNPGTADTPVDLSAVMTSENGYLSASIPGGGSIAIGDINGQVVPNGNKVSVDWDIGFQDTIHGEQNKYPSQQFPSSPIDGSWDIRKWASNDWAAYVKNYGLPTNPVNGQIYGSSLYFGYKEPSAHVLCWTNMHFNSGYNKNKTYGNFEMTLVDAQGAGIAGYRINKIEGSTDHLEMHLWVGNDVVASWTNAKGTGWIMHNFSGPLQIEKNGADIVFSMRNEYNNSPWHRTYHYSGLENTKVAGVNYYFGQFFIDNSPNTPLYAGIGYTQGISYQKNWRVTSNMFQPGDQVDFISSQQTMPVPYVRSLPAYDIMSNGSTQLMAPAQSMTTIYLDWSDTSTAPQVTATLRPRYI
jgi:predicted phage tail component-like protein